MSFSVSEPTADQIQEAISEAVNNIVKHFHKPEKEVVCVCVCTPLYCVSVCYGLGLIFSLVMLREGV